MEIVVNVRAISSSNKSTNERKNEKRQNLIERVMMNLMEFQIENIRIHIW